MDVLKEIFKETNGHIRACDNKSLAFNGAYIAISSIIFSRYNEVYKTIYSIIHFGSNDGKAILANIVIFSIILFFGYMSYFAQIWFRNWKLHYVNVCREIYDAYGVDGNGQALPAPIWMIEEQSNKDSFDFVVRMIPMIGNTASWVFLYFIVITKLYIALNLYYLLLFLLVMFVHLAIWKTLHEEAVHGASLIA